jgi:acetyl/propionyl-CoA carboxylase alpha subunit
MLSKLIAWGGNRSQAVERMLRALKEYELAGIQTNIPFLKRVMENESFKKGRYTTAFIEENMEQLRAEDKNLVLVAAIGAVLGSENSSGKDSNAASKKSLSAWKIVRRKQNLV